jgi:predicted molibdopterin-dependent oxidoreductase YjgC
LSYHELNNGERVARPLLKGRDGMQAPVVWEHAARSINSSLEKIAGEHGADAILGFASASATNEALFLFKRYLADQLGASRFDFRLDSEDQKVTQAEDQILRHVDKHPNSMGAMKLGLMSDELGGIEGAIEAARAGRIKAGVIIYFKPLVRREGDQEVERRLAALVEALEYSVVLAAHKADWQAAASAVLPVAAWSEEEGTYTNFQGRVQLAGKAVEPGGDILPVWEVFAMLINAGGAKSPWMSPDDVFTTMAESVPTFGNITLEQRRAGALATS